MLSPPYLDMAVVLKLSSMMAVLPGYSLHYGLDYPKGTHAVVKGFLKYQGHNYSYEALRQFGSHFSIRENQKLTWSFQAFIPRAA